MAVGDFKCFTVVSDTDPSIFSTYCAKLEDLTFSPSQGVATVTIEIFDRDDADGGVTITPNVEIRIGGQTIFNQAVDWPNPGGDHAFIQESGAAVEGDTVQLIVTDTDEQFTINATVGGSGVSERTVQALMAASGLVGLGIAVR